MGAAARGAVMKKRRGEWRKRRRRRNKKRGHWPSLRDSTGRPAGTGGGGLGLLHLQRAVVGRVFGQGWESRGKARRVHTPMAARPITHTHEDASLSVSAARAPPPTHRAAPPPPRVCFPVCLCTHTHTAWRTMRLPLLVAALATHAALALASCPPVDVGVALWALNASEAASSCAVGTAPSLCGPPRRPPDADARAPRASFGPPPPLDVATTTEGTVLQTVPWPGGVSGGGMSFVARVRGTLALEWRGRYSLSLIHPPSARAGLAIDGVASDNATVTLQVDKPRTATVEAVFWWVGAPPATPPPFLALLWEFGGGGASAHGRRIARGGVWDGAWVAPGCVL